MGTSLLHQLSSEVIAWCWKTAARGASTQLSFYASGWGYSPWAIQNPARLELELDREEYLPGQTAKQQIRSPFSGRLLLTVESHGVHFVRIYDLEGNSATISVPVQAAYSPNAYLTATLVRSVADLDPTLRLAPSELSRSVSTEAPIAFPSVWRCPSGYFPRVNCRSM